MQSQQIRKAFLDFFESKSHKIVPSAPVVIKDDPTLMFTNAGMNQFKDIFLGNQAPASKRVADTQKCLRVSGKHNDIEEVGVDTYHHTLFEMLGNWSFGEYFKEEAISWAWELLTEVFKIPQERLYATIFEGDKTDGLEGDEESFGYWKKYLPEERILRCSKKDNFWEMGDTGPCGPCSELHVDLRSEEERKAVDGASLVNMDHPEVIEIWNLVFMQFNRKSDKSLEKLPATHVDTGMGFERICMALQGKTSSYDTDVFQPLIKVVEEMSGKAYGKALETDIAMRVIVDHIRAVSFTIADGQLPSNTGAGYVIRRILRRAVRYGYSYLDFKEPFMHKLVQTLSDQMKAFFPEIGKQQELVTKVVREEEASFMRTLESGMKRLDQIEAGLKAKGEKTIDGQTAFELYDTFGFPIDLTRLIAEERSLKIDEVGFEKHLSKQKERSRAAAEVDASDWVEVNAGGEIQFVGYDKLTSDTRVLRYREVKQKKGKQVQIVLEETPFYAESGGQIGDTGFLQIGDEKLEVLDTKKENDLIIHFLKQAPKQADAPVQATVDKSKRTATASNHTATHLLHSALRIVLGEHVEQKGSYVGPDRLRFDFSHFSKMTEEEISTVEKMVNERVRQNIPLDEQRSIPIAEAQAAGAMALFGEKYGDEVRMITFDPDYSRELCGGTHVQATGQIGMVKVISESGIAAGVRRIELISGKAVEAFVNEQLQSLDQIKGILKQTGDPLESVKSLQEENAKLRKTVEDFNRQQLGVTREKLRGEATNRDGINWISAKVDLPDADSLKQLSFDLRKELDPLVLVLGAQIGEKALLSIMLSDSLVADKGWNAGKVIREASREISGGGGGQPFYATAGGKNPAGLPQAIEKAIELFND